MKVINLGTVAYAPGVAPSEPEQLRRYIEDEFKKVAAAISLLALGHIDKSNVAPVKPRDGDIRYADGTAWNPGSGVGIYYYKASAWVFLG